MSQLRPRLSWKPWASGALATLCLPLVSSCFYSFDNPVEKEPPGSVAGTIALQDAVGGQTAAGGQVTVQWTNGLQLSLSTEDKFLFQDLPDGTYSLEVNIPPAAGNDFPLVLLRPDVVLPNVGGTTDSLNIGTLEVSASGVVGGRVSPADAGIVVGAFVPGGSPSTVGVFEGFQTTTDSTGSYSLMLPAGSHALAASGPLDEAVGSATIFPGQSQTVNLTLSPAAPAGQISGELIGSGFGVSSSTNSVPWAGATYTAVAADGLVVGSGELFPTGPESSGSGSSFTVKAPGGELVSLTLIPPPQASPDPCATFSRFMLPAVPIIAGQSTFLGQVTWLDDAALGANGIGPCADAGSPGVTGTTGGTTGGGTTGGGTTGGGTTGGGTTGNGPGSNGTVWVDAGLVFPDAGGIIQQTVVLPFTSDGSGYVVAWIGGPVGQTNAYSETSQGAFTQAPLTMGGQVTPGTLSGTQLGSGVLLTFATDTGPSSTYCEFISPTGGPQGSAPPLPTNPGIGNEGTTTFAGQLNGVAGAFVLQPLGEDAGVAGVFTADGTSFGTPFALVPGGANLPIQVLNLVGTSCDVADLHGDAGFCLAGSGRADIDGGIQYVGFVASVETSGGTPSLDGTFLMIPPIFGFPIFEGIAALPGKVAVAIGVYADSVYYWTLSDLTLDAGAGTMIDPEVDVLIDWGGSVLGLSLAHARDTTLEFYPDGGEPPPPPALTNFVNGVSSVAATGYLDPSSNTVVTAGVSASTYSGSISILRLSPR